MSRQEDFKQKATEYNNNVNMHLDFYNGAEHGYQYAVEKACEWLENELHKGLWGKSQSAFIEQFKYAMEE